MSGGGGDTWRSAPRAARKAFSFFSDKLPPLVKVVFFTGGMVRILFSTSLCEGGDDEGDDMRFLEMFNTF